VALDREATLKKAEKLLRQGKLSAAIDEYVRLVEDQPRDFNAMNTLGDLHVRAGDPDRAVAQFVRGADHLFGEGFFPKASALYKKALKIKPDHEHTLSRLAEIAARQGVLVDAKAYLKQLADRRRLRGDLQGADECLKRLRVLDDEPSEPVDPRSAGSSSEDPEVLIARAIDLAQAGDMVSAIQCIDRVTDEALLAGNWDRAVAVLQTFVRAAPHIPSLIKLVELSVDAGLEQPLREAQTLLADAYLDAGKGAEARYIAEDLLEHEPGSPEHTARLQRARHLLGMTDAPAETAFATPAETASATPAETASATPEQQAEVSSPIEVDLSDLLSGIRMAPMAVVQETPRPEPAPTPVPDARDEYTRALELLIAGQTAEAISRLERAARSPQWRFKAASELGRLYMERGDLQVGADWLERAAEAAAPAPEDGFAVLYDLAGALEQLGESARALAILMELDADAGEYRDVRSRIDTLARTRAGSQSR
jgi:tetratricopeptide (TPR) repeat protein